MMQTDVKMAHLNANGTVFASTTRVKGYQLAPGGTAGQINFYDTASNTATGTQRLQLDTTVNTAVISTLIPGEGIRFDNGVFVTLPANAAITVFYG
jgi:hypothetical protein